VKGEGWLFVTNDAETSETLRPMIALFVDLIGRRLLALPDHYERRLFFILDKFGTLQSLSTIVRLLTLSRSKGGSVWLGIQDLGQIDKIYGEPLRQAIVNACGTAAIFSVSDPKTAKFLSTKIGETEFLETEETYSMGVDDHRDGLSLMQRRKVEPLILPSEIMQLKGLELFLQIPNIELTREPMTQSCRETIPSRVERLVGRGAARLSKPEGFYSGGCFTLTPLSLLNAHQKTV